MKKIIFKTLVLVTCLIMFGSNSFAQLTASKSDAGTKESVKTSENSTSLETGTMAISKVSTKVQRSFLKYFKAAETASWSVTNTDYIADFHLNDRHVLAWFSRSGYNYCTIYYGQEKHLPLSEKMQVNKAYEGYEITVTQEIRTAAGISWIITLQDCKNILQVKLADDALTELSRVQRSK